MMIRRTTKIGSKDFLSTPHWVTGILLNHIEFIGPIWEPACGDGKMAKDLKKYGYTILSSDLCKRGFGKTGVDFLNEKLTWAPNIVTNPPYVIANKFVNHALELYPSGKVAVLMRTLFLEGKYRHEMYKRFRPSEIIVISDRVDMCSEKPGRAFSLSWFVWDFSKRTKITKLSWAKYEGDK
jgi:hypothetical protein